MFLYIQKNLNEGIFLKVVFSKNSIHFCKVIPDVEDRTFFLLDLPQAFSVIFGFILKEGKLVKQLFLFDADGIGFSQYVQSLQQKIVLF